MNIQQDKPGYMIIGKKEDVQKLKNALQDKATNPRNFMSLINNGGLYQLNEQLIANIESHFKKIYNN